jgi:serine/threonine protein kinase
MLVVQDFEAKVLTIKQPGLVKVKGITLENKKFNLVFDKTKGFRMSKYLEMKGSCNPALVIKIVSEILKVFDHLVQNGYTYGEVKLENISICNGKAVLNYSEVLTH